MAMGGLQPACGFGAEEVKERSRAEPETALVGQSAFLILSFSFLVEGRRLRR